MKCPEFSLIGVHPGSSEKKYSLADTAQTDKVLLYFYPKDNTPGCSVEAIDFTQNFQKFLDLGITVVGVSPDSISAHCNFQEKKDLGVLLLSDPEKSLIIPIGAWGEKMNYGKKYTGLIRSTFLIERTTGKILAEWKNVRAKGHADRMLKEVQKF